MLWRVVGQALEGPLRRLAEGDGRGGIVLDMLQGRARGHDGALAAKLRRHDAGRRGRLPVPDARDEHIVQPTGFELRIELGKVGQCAERGGRDDGARLPGGVEERGAAKAGVIRIGVVGPGAMQRLGVEAEGNRGLSPAVPLNWLPGYRVVDRRLRRLYRDVDPTV